MLILYVDVRTSISHGLKADPSFLQVEPLVTVTSRPSSGSLLLSLTTSSVSISQHSLSFVLLRAYMLKCTFSSHSSNQRAHELIEADGEVSCLRKVKRHLNYYLPPLSFWGCSKKRHVHFFIQSCQHSLNCNKTETLLTQKKSSLQSLIINTENSADIAVRASL
ncbi:hypothetical protein BC829DRAFT_177034 [Chytridium lagenaria]|nr:hypothetical protein BC829DRAFT_177034 [Chytridium lagenaria]